MRLIALMPTHCEQRGLINADNAYPAAEKELFLGLCLERGEPHSTADSPPGHPTTPRFQRIRCRWGVEILRHLRLCHFSFSFLTHSLRQPPRGVVQLLHAAVPRSGT